MKWIETLFGQGEHLTVLQMCLRALVIYLLAVLYVRLAGKRAFGKISTFDNIIVITLGAMLSRAIVGISPFLHILASTLVLVFFHRFVAWITQRNHSIGKIVKGEPVSLFKDGKLNEKNLRKNLISHSDLMEEVRIKSNENSLDNIEEIFLERNGEFGVIKKTTDHRPRTTIQ
jgi:uncharacterized membrane protein YcaP (DUF421 family)